MKTLVFSVASIVGAIWGSAQSIVVTSYPPAGQPGFIQGYVTNAPNPTIYKIPLVDEVVGTFWSKPLASEPWVTDGPDGTFTGIFITGGQDACAEKIILFLVPTNASVPVVLGGGSVPPALYSMAVDMNIVDRSSGSNQLVWVNRKWNYKHTADCFWGPGPNKFSRDCVSIDAQGKLHMAIKYLNGAWRCPEIILAESLHYGIYRITVETDLSTLPEQIVAGIMFTYDDGAPPYYREIDVEYSNGALVGSDLPFQNVVQPFTASGQRNRYNAPSGLTNSTHTIIWLPGIASFSSYSGHPALDYGYRLDWQLDALGTLGYPTVPLPLDTVTITSPTNTVVRAGITAPDNSFYYRAQLTAYWKTANQKPFQQWSTNRGVAAPGEDHIHINLWLYNSAAPGPENQSFEVVFSDFAYEPVDIESLRPRLQMHNTTPLQQTVEFIYPGK
jgi:hypothetical protein